MTIRKFATTMITGALLTAGAAFAAANVEQTRADINFKFRTPAGEMPAGKYDVEVRSFQGGNRYIALNNVETRKTVMFFTESPIEARNSGASTRLTFVCAKSGDCNLAEVWAKQSVGYQISRPRLSAADMERMAVVTLQPAVAGE